MREIKEPKAPSFTENRSHLYFSNQFIYEKGIGFNMPLLRENNSIVTIDFLWNYNHKYSGINWWTYRAAYAGFIPELYRAYPVELTWWTAR